MTEPDQEQTEEFLPEEPEKEPEVKPEDRPYVYEDSQLPSEKRPY